LPRDDGARLDTLADAVRPRGKQAAPPASPPPAAAAATFSGTDTDLTADQLQTLVAPIALYPDDLVAIVLPASA
jgi:hypothetical protein